ncbi:hypothetical protein KAR91_67185 [Candidatus Pacearchaeota archaeon]|nr:hypothetical protein [Candidatus Pacearchaeota archaeon]
MSEQHISAVKGIAFDLMLQIASTEKEDTSKDKAYWIDLYKECYKVINTPEK